MFGVTFGGRLGNRLPWDDSCPRDERVGAADVDSSGRRDVPYFLDRMISRRERKGGVKRALILTLSILAIIDSAHIQAGMSSTPANGRCPPIAAIAASEATQQTEEQIISQGKAP